MSVKCEKCGCVNEDHYGECFECGVELEEGRRLVAALNREINALDIHIGNLALLASGLSDLCSVLEEMKSTRPNT